MFTFFFNFEVFPGISHWGKKNVKNSILLKTCQLRYLNFRAKNQIENPRISVLWLRKFMKYLNFRAKNQIEISWILVLWLQKFMKYLNFCAKNQIEKSLDFNIMGSKIRKYLNFRAKNQIENFWISVSKIYLNLLTKNDYLPQCEFPDPELQKRDAWLVLNL